MKIIVRKINININSPNPMNYWKKNLVSFDINFELNFYGTRYEFNVYRLITDQLALF